MKNSSRMLTHDQLSVSTYLPLVTKNSPASISGVVLDAGEPVPEAASHGVPATPFIVGDTYGTRSSTVVTVQRPAA